MVTVDYNIIPLRAAMRNDNGSMQNILESYHDCVGSDQEKLLRNDAVMMEMKNMCRTYLAMDSGQRILGYFSIGLRCMKVPDSEETNNRFRSKMNIDPESKVAQSYLIGQLSRSKDAPKGFGSDLLEDAIRMIVKANLIVGCRVVRVDCADRLIDYYGKHGFRFIGKNESKDLNQMAYILRA